MGTEVRICLSHPGDCGKQREADWVQYVYFNPHQHKSGVQETEEGRAAVAFTGDLQEVPLTHLATETDKRSMFNPSRVYCRFLLESKAGYVHYLAPPQKLTGDFYELEKPDYMLSRSLAPVLSTRHFDFRSAQCPVWHSCLSPLQHVQSGSGVAHFHFSSRALCWTIDHSSWIIVGMQKLDTPLQDTVECSAVIGVNLWSEMAT